MQYPHAVLDFLQEPWNSLWTVANALPLRRSKEIFYYILTLQATY